jgi:hypothetical protein
MSTYRRWILGWGIAAVAACSGSSSGPPADSGSGKHDAPVDVSLDDFGCAGGSACASTDVCCAMPGNPFTFACVAQATCPMSQQINCDGPDECGGATPICCGVDVPDGTGTYPQCNAASVGTSCTSAAACPTHLGQTCTDTTKVQICHVAAECTDATNNKCCTFVSGAASLTFCIDSFTAQVGGATCHT